MDADGVLTNGQIIYDSEGKETKNFDVQDGLGIVLLKRAGLKTAILTARASKAVEIRAKDLKVDRLYQDAFPKEKFYKRLLRDLRLKDEEACFIGDDLPDVPVLKRVGLAVAVPGACVDVKKAVHYVTRKKGGAGAVREVVELILKAQGMWSPLIARFNHG